MRWRARYRADCPSGLSTALLEREGVRLARFEIADGCWLAVVQPCAGSQVGRFVQGRCDHHQADAHPSQGFAGAVGVVRADAAFVDEALAVVDALSRLRSLAHAIDLGAGSATRAPPGEGLAGAWCSPLISTVTVRP